MRRFRPYFSYLKAVRGSIILALLCGIVYGAANGAGLPLMVKKIFPKIFDPEAARLTDWQLMLIALWLPTIFALRGVAGYFNSYLIQYAGTRILEALRLDYFRKLQVLPVSFLQRQKTGDLISRGMTDTQTLQTALTTFANDIFKQPTTLIGALGYLGYLAYTERGVWLVLVSMAVIPLCILPIRYVGKRLINRARQLQGQLGQVSERFSENLNAAREVRAFSLEEIEINRLRTLTNSLVVSQMKVTKYTQALTPSIELISAAGISMTLVYAYKTGLSLPAFVSIITALYTCYDPIKKLGALQNITKIGSAALDRLEVVLNAPNSIADPVNPVPLGRAQGNLAFEHVVLTYDNDTAALRDVSISIPAGTTCALVGPSGAGKSTFANLVPRFYDVSSGRITLDGVDIRDVSLADLRRNIAIVSQEPVLFNDTVYNNLLLGRHDATREEVEQAARDAFAHDFILTLPQGYETIVGERGATLSGGQRQRLAVARAFLRNAPILILDEATSALDSESEAAIQLALRKLVVGKTVLIIAHRFSTIRDASLILVFDQGRIIDAGPHTELYERNPLYKGLYNRQGSFETA
ncbi:ABC transporter ATP-binding protein [Rariglobus hedericola]|uniref:ABC transporter ATP-binding protein n=1 Tax=Rariglobus hedericola TaxID=2597822 RepID=A0A556QQ24_9BACT|nr:ABC transporter ATP-binding protein [Rariglobus hedericola]TSJ78746.1 ABC transporter ATP-binding protein [Rariglobus hedericola]